jgi:hypothetical protein
MMNKKFYNRRCKGAKIASILNNYSITMLRNETNNRNKLLARKWFESKKF